MCYIRQRDLAQVKWVSAVTSLLFCVSSARAGDLFLGYGASASGVNAMAFGYGSAAGGDNSIAAGALSRATGSNTTAIGNLGAALGNNSVAIGVLSWASGANSTAVGNLSAARGDNSAALGVLSTASGANSTAFGNLSSAHGANGTAVGILAAAHGANGTAIGNQSAAIGANSNALGSQSIAAGDDSLAFGTQSAARGYGSVVIGNSASALWENSIAIGNNSVTSAPNVVSFGAPGAERRLVNVAPGVLPTDAATFGQLTSLARGVERNFATIDRELTALATPSARINAAFSAINSSGPSTVETVPIRAKGTFAVQPWPINKNHGRTADTTTESASPRPNSMVRNGTRNAPTGDWGFAGAPRTIAPRTSSPGARAGTATIGATTPAAPAVAASGTRINTAISGIAGSDAATYSQLQDVSGGLQSQIAGLQGQIADTRCEARAGTALALASSGLHYDPRPGKASLAAAFGTYKGQSGLAVGLAYTVSERWRVNAAFAGSPDVSEYGVVAGASWTLN
jgi:autotransporter adhesin